MSASSERSSTLAAAAALAVPHLLLACLAPAVLDERAVVDIGRMVVSPCIDAMSTPWDQPPLMFIASGLVFAIAARVADVGTSLDAPILAARLAFALSPSLVWLLARRLLPEGVGPSALYVSLLAAPPVLQWSGLAMVHGFAGLFVLLAVLGLAREGADAASGRRIATFALVAAVATSYAAWPALTALGLCVVIRPHLRDRLRCFGPAAVLGLGWLALATSQREWLALRLSRSQGAPPNIPLDTLSALNAVITGRGDGPVVAVALMVGLALVGTAVGGPLRRDLRELLVAVAWGTWPVLWALSPIAWMGRGKFLFLLHWPLVLLASAGLARLLARRGSLVHGAAAVAAFLLWGAGAVSFAPKVLHRGDTLPWAPPPLSWSCAEPHRPSHVLLPKVKPLLRRAPPPAAGEPGVRARGGTR